MPTLESSLLCVVILLCHVVITSPTDTPNLQLVKCFMSIDLVTPVVSLVLGCLDLVTN